MAREPRYRWLGSVPHARALRWLASSHAMVISSRMEGGANVVCEALRIGVPVLASRIPGNLGLLGGGYAGYFDLEDERALARLIRRAAGDAGFYGKLKEPGAAAAQAWSRRAPRHAPCFSYSVLSGRLAASPYRKAGPALSPWGITCTHSPTGNSSSDWAMIWPFGVLTTYWCVSPFWRSFDESAAAGLAEKAHPGELRALAHHAEHLLHRAFVALPDARHLVLHRGAGHEGQQGEPGEPEHGSQHGARSVNCGTGTPSPGGSPDFP